MAMKTKIPPPLIAFLFGIAMWFVANSRFGTRASSEYLGILAGAFGVAGIVIAAKGILQFRSASTTVNPHRPENATSLVRGGIFSYSRNPMYVGLAFLLVAWAVWLGSLANVVLLLIFALATTELQIKPEEAVLEKLFGSDYENYRKQVRRWI